MSSVSIQQRNQNYPPTNQNSSAFDSLVNNSQNGGKYGGQNDFDSRHHHRPPMDYDARNSSNRENGDYRSSGPRHDSHRSSSYRPLAASNSNESSSFNQQQAEQSQHRQRRSRFTDNTDVVPAPQPMANYSDPFQGSNSRAGSQPSRWNNNKTPSYEPASKTPNYAPSKTPSHVTNDEDWDDGEPVRAPMQATLTPNRFNNNKTPSYVPNDNDYRGPPAASQQQRFNNNKTPSYAPPPAADDEDWDDDNVNAMQTDAPKDFNNRGLYNRGADTQRNYSGNNNYDSHNRSENNNYARNKSPGGGYNGRGGAGGYNGNNRPARNQHYSEENWDDDAPVRGNVQPVVPQPTTPAARYANDDDWDE